MLCSWISRGPPRLGDLPRRASALILAVIADLRLRDVPATSELNITTINILTLRSYSVGNTLLATRGAHGFRTGPAKPGVRKSTSRWYVPFSSVSLICLPVSTFSMKLRSLPTKHHPIASLTILETDAKGLAVARSEIDVFLAEVRHPPASVVRPCTQPW